MSKKYDFSGYVTKYNVFVNKDKRTIMPKCFEHQDGKVVPLVYRHLRQTITNVLGSMLLEERPDGVYGYGSFNHSNEAAAAKAAVEHGDINSMSIYATGLEEEPNGVGYDVKYGNIEEVSLVLNPANKGARIDKLSVEHADGSLSELEEAIITFDSSITLEHEDNEAGEEKTVEDILATMTDDQYNATVALVAAALAQKGEVSHMNCFENNQKTLSHEELTGIIDDARKFGSLKRAVLEHAADYGVENIEYLFPDYKEIENSPFVVSVDKNDSWAEEILNRIPKSPFTKLKSLFFDISMDEARAKGYIKGNYKTEEVFSLFKRTATPTTVYKKQKVDRDDVVDIKDFDIVAFIKKEMQVKLKEELVRALLIGDGREVTDQDKVDESCIIPIDKDTTNNVYCIHEDIAEEKTGIEVLEEIAKAISKDYRGSGIPDFYTSYTTRSEWLMLRDIDDKRYFKSEAELCSFLGVRSIVPLAILDEHQAKEAAAGSNWLGLVVNISDYALGLPELGKAGMFDDFDIDFNQYKYLIETRASGMLVRPYGALKVTQDA